MKMVFNLASRSTIRAIARAVCLLGCLVASGGLVRPAAAQAVYFSPRAVLADFFPKSQAVTYQRFELSAELRARLLQRLGYEPPKSAYSIYIAKTGETVDGYAILDEEMGQHLPITFAVKLSPQGVVQRQEIMIYRERFGDEVRDPRFRQQFVGKSATDPLRPGEEIVAVSGATISSRAMAVGVKRSLVLVEELLLGPQRLQNQKATAVSAVQPARESGGARL